MHSLSVTNPGRPAPAPLQQPITSNYMALRVIHCLPPPDPLGILLIGADQGPLRRKAQPGEQLPDSLKSVRHSEFPPDQIPDNLACPQRILELKLPRIAPDNPPAELLGLRLVKLRSSPRSFPEREERIQAVGLVI